MGRATWVDADGTKRGEWTEEEDHKLVAYIQQYGIGDWRFLPDKAGLKRCGKSCRLRWLNYLRPGIKKGRFSPQEEQVIINLHSVVGNRWAAIAQQMPNRSDNDIKNHWNSCLKKRLERNGIDPMTHKPLIINNKTVKTEYSSSSSLGPSNKSIGIGSVSMESSWSSQRRNSEISFQKKRTEQTASPSSSSSSSFSVWARLLNKIATNISSRHYCVDSMKNILSVPRNTNINPGQEEESKKDPEMIIGMDDQQEMWDNEDMRRFMEEISVIEFETTSYDRVYNSSFDFSSSPYNVYESDLLDDHLI